jgi:hypothetical protein
VWVWGAGVSERIIAARPPNDGREWDNQCARCGSSVDRELCEDCGGDGYVEAGCFEDSCCCANPEVDHDYETCHACAGSGGWWRCLSSEEFCGANPLPGRGAVSRGEVEWFPVTRGASRL